MTRSFQKVRAGKREKHRRPPFAIHAASEGWLAAQQSDPEFISPCAATIPTREDIAESFLLWLPLRYRAERIVQEANTIETTIPARLSYPDAQGFSIAPMD